MAGQDRLSPPHIEAYIWDMRLATDPHDKLENADMPAERGYDAWKRVKVKRGLAQAQDRSAMIPVEQVLRDLKIEH
jgi:hypothetical protein